MPYVLYLDESPALSAFCTKAQPVFVIGLVAVPSELVPSLTARWRQWRHAQMPKRLRKRAEIKFADVITRRPGETKKADWSFARSILRQMERLAAEGVRYRAAVLHREGNEAAWEGRTPAEIYTAATLAALRALDLEGTGSELHYDRGALRGAALAAFEGALREAGVQPQAAVSYAVKGVQLADWIAGAVRFNHTLTADDREQGRAFDVAFVGTVYVEGGPDEDENPSGDLRDTGGGPSTGLPSPPPSAESPF